MTDDIGKVVLKPCPFCGSTDIGEDYIQTYSVDSSYDVFGCRGCGARFENGNAADWNRRLESAAAPVEVDGVGGYATGMEARDMHAEATLLRTLARQLSDSEASRREAEAALAKANAENKRLYEIEAAAVKVEEDANAFAADLERWAHDPLVGLTPMRLEDVKHHATRIRAIACNLAGARSSKHKQAESHDPANC